MSKHNANTRALTSAMRSDIAVLRMAAVTHIDDLTKGAESPVRALIEKLGTSWPTAKSLMREREQFSKSGKTRRRS